MLRTADHASLLHCSCEGLLSIDIPKHKLLALRDTLSQPGACKTTCRLLNAVLDLAPNPLSRDCLTCNRKTPAN